ncbi:MAG: hypothetical protein ACHRHE_10285 [Tepidisphaerales bacterium]
MLVYYWPEAAGGLVALLTLWWIARVARRPQVPGEQHCRCCNYLLKGLLSGRCPECGTYLTPRNRLAGRRRWPRVLGALVFLLVGAGGYFWAGPRLPRQGSVSTRLDWTSMSIAEWAEAGGRTWITRHVTNDDVVLLADAEKAKVRRTICRVQTVKDEKSLGHAVLSADRHYIFCWRRDDIDAGVAQVELASGKVVRQFKGKWGAFARISVSADGSARTLFNEVQVFMDSYHALSALDVQTGQALSKISLRLGDKVGVLTASNHDFAVIAAMMHREDGEPLASEVRVWDPVSGQIVKSFKTRGVAVGSDDGTAYVALQTDGSLEIQSWDALSGKRTNSVKVGRVEYDGLTVANGTLIVESIPTLRVPRKFLAVHLRTGARRSWIVAGTLPGTESVTPSPDGRHVLMTIEEVVRAQSGEVRIYDLSGK